MKPSRKSRFTAIAVSVATASLSAAFAEPIYVENYSFEFDIAPVGGVVETPPTGWISYYQTGSKDIGSQNPKDTQFTVNNPFAYPAEGNQFLYLNTFPENPNGVSGVYQTVGELMPNMTYTLTVAIGSRLDRLNTPGTISLVNGEDYTGTVLATGGGLPAVQDTWEDFSISFTTGDTVEGYLTIVLSTVAAGTIQADFDNVRLDMVPVPEPSTIASLMAAAGLGGLVLRRRRRAVE